MDEGTLGIHEIELVRKSTPSLGDGSGVGQHADSAVDLGQVTVGNGLRWLVTDTNLEASWAPIDKLNGTLGLEVGNSSVAVLRDNITTVQQAGGHVFAIAGIALHHLVVGLEAGVGDFHDRIGFMGSLRSGNDGSVGDEREVNTGVWHQVGLELVQVNIQGTIETQRGSNG